MTEALRNLLEDWSEDCDLDDYRSRIEKLLNEHDYYKKNPNPVLVVESTTYDLRPPAIAGLIIEALKTLQPNEVYAKVEITFALDLIDVEMFAFVENVTTAYEIDLGDNVSALPESNAPDALFEDQILRAKNEVKRQGLILRSKFSEHAIRTCSSPPGHPVNVEEQAHYGKAAITTAIRLITLDGPSSPQLRVWTYRPVQDLGILPVFVHFSFERMQRLSDGMPEQISDKTKKLLKPYRELSEKHQKRVNAAIDRLNLGMSEVTPSDRIVEAAIALEAILSDDEKQELTYRHRLRSALLLEKSYAQRKAVKELVRKLYAERSQVLHTGIPGKGDASLAVQSLVLAGRLIERIIEIAMIPEWDTIELTDGDMSRATNE